MNSKISINLDTLNVEKSDELLEIFDVEIKDNVLYLEISRPEPEVIYPYTNLTT
jgi:hypothetical protein